MEKINILIFLVSIGFLVIGITFLKSKSIKNSIESMGTYKDINKYTSINGMVNIIAGLLIAVFNIIDIVLKTSYELYLVLPIIILSSLVTTILNKKTKA